MSSMLLVIITVVLVAVVLLGAVSFPLVPAFFGVYGQAAKQPLGRLIIRLLWVFPLFTLVSLGIAWRMGAGYIAILPFLYLLFIWLIRANKQDSSAPQKRFSVQQQNIEEQRRELEYKWASWVDNNNASAYLSFEAWAPNEKQALGLRDFILRSEDVIGEVHLENAGGGSVVLTFGLVLNAFERSEIVSEIDRVVDFVWQFSCELSSTEVEPFN